MRRLLSPAIQTWWWQDRADSRILAGIRLPTPLDPPLLKGWLTAVDVASGDVAWRYASPLPMVGAVLSTAGDLVLAGEVTGDLVAFQAESGKELARIPTGAPIGGGVVTHEVDQRQYVAVATGKPSGFWVSKDVGPPTIVVLSVGAQGS